jgi:hypothetical protein
MKNFLSILLIIIGILFLIVDIGLCKIKNCTKKTITILLITSLLLIISGIVLYFLKIQNKQKEYLMKVYPMMDPNRFPDEYKKLYNSLGWYYQCCNENKTNIIYSDKNWQIYGNEIVGPFLEKPNVLRYIPDIRGNSDFHFGLFNNKIKSTWEKMRCCKSPYKLPTTPYGNFYDWSSLQYFNVPIITNNSSGWKFAGTDKNPKFQRNIDTLVSQSPYTTFQGIIFENNGQKSNISPNDPNGVKDGIPPGLWAGPGPFYAGERAIMRAMYYPNGPQFDYYNQIWKMDNISNSDNWLNQYLTRGKIQMTDFSNKKAWLAGFKKGDYMEIGHVQQIPGLVQSTGYWFNYFGGGGTGVFYQVGETPKVTQDAVDEMVKYLPNAKDLVDCSPRNKAHALFTLLWEVKNTEKLNRNSGSYNFKNSETYTNGSDLLKAFYGTDDPWYITMWHANGRAPVIGSEKSWSDFNSKFEPTGVPLPDWAIDYDNKNFVNPVSWASPPWILDYNNIPSIGPNTKLISRQLGTTFIQALSKIQNIDVNTEKTINLQKFYGTMNDTDAGVLYATLCAFLLQCEFKNNVGKYVNPPKKYSDGTLNTQPNLFSNFGGIGSITYEGLKYSLIKGFMGNWFYDRVSNGVTFDEPINYFSRVLGYDTIQMTCNTNTNGYWSYESIFTGLPNKSDNLHIPESHEAYEWNNLVISQRKYPYIKNATYFGPYVSIFNELFSKKLSQRDPFNLTRSIPCFNMGGFDCKNTPGVICNKKNKVNGKINGNSLNDDYFEAECKVKPNIGMLEKPENSSTVLWDPNDFCHKPWGLQNFGTGGVLWGQANGFAHSFCQSNDEEPTLSSIWSNVPYGGKGYGDGLVVSKSELQK